MNKQKNQKEKLLVFVQFSLLLAIEIIVCFTPLGTLPAIGSLSATLSHIPVIITAILLGTSWGAGMGLAFGTCSFIYWTFVAPGVFSFIYTPFYSAGVYQGNFFSLVICFLPRILIGVVCALVYKLLFKTTKKEKLSALIAGAAGSLTNTVLVLGGIFFVFAKEYSELSGTADKALSYVLGITVLTNGLPEALLGALSAAFIAIPVKNIVMKNK